MNAATIIAIASVVISAIIVVMALLVASTEIARARDDMNRKINLAYDRVDAMSTRINELNNVIDAALTRQENDQREIEYLTLQIATLQGQLDQERNTMMN